jgi:NADPH:quinone reductase-like Zn-dependent oxidoreductase
VKVFKSLLINKTDDRYSTQLAEIAESELPQGDVEVNIDYSSINYKDALAITGRGPIVRTFQWCQALILPVRCPPVHIRNIRPEIRFS